MTMTRKLAGQDLNPIGLGCMNLCWAYGDPPAPEDARALLNRALDSGYTHLDTANIYGLGKSEQLIGEALQGRRKEFFLASKTWIVVTSGGRDVDCSPDAIAASIDGSLQRLRTDHIDLLYMHRFDPKVPIADSVGALARAIEAGKIGGYGVSEWSAAHIREAHRIHPVTAVQTEYSLWTRNVELGVLETTRELGIAFVAFSPVGRGGLCGELDDPASLPVQDFRRRMPRFMPDHWPANREVVAGLVALAREAGVTAAQLALAWVLSRGDHVHAIPGTARVPHLEDNIRAADLSIAPEVLARADALVNPGTVSGHRYPDAMRAMIDTEEPA